MRLMSIIMKTMLGMIKKFLKINQSSETSMMIDRFDQQNNIGIMIWKRMNMNKKKLKL